MDTECVNAVDYTCADMCKPFVLHRDAIQDSAAAANGPRIRNVLMLLITLSKYVRAIRFLQGCDLGLCHCCQ
jgi:hypothetical protein